MSKKLTISKLLFEKFNVRKTDKGVEKIVDESIPVVFGQPHGYVPHPTNSNFLDSFPKPLQDTGRGIHWTTSTVTHWDDSWEWDSKWKPYLLDCKIKWVKLMVQPADKSNLELIKRLIGLGIMPIVRFYLHEAYPDPVPVSAINYARFLVEEYGVTYFEFGNEPDLSLEWVDRQMPPYPEWENIVVDRFVAAWDAMAPLETGAVPIFDAYGPGGQGSPFQRMVDIGRSDVFQRMAIAVHNYGLGRPLNYPDDPITQQGRHWTQTEYDEYCDENWGSELQGEPWQTIWESTLDTVNEAITEGANPGETILENSTGFRAFEYLNHLAVEACGFSLPCLMTEGGNNVLQVAPYDMRYPKLGDRHNTKLMMGMFDDYDYPSYYFCNGGVWFIAAEEMGNPASAYEYQYPQYTKVLDNLFNLNGELSLVQALRDSPGRVLADGPTPEKWDNFQLNPTLEGRSVDDTVPLINPQITIETPMENDLWWCGEILHKENVSGYVYVRCLNIDGNPIEGVPFTMEDRFGNVYNAATKGVADDGWGNLPLGSLQAGDAKLWVDEGYSEVVHNIGNGRVDERSGGTDTYLTFWLVDEVPELPPIEPPDPPVDPVEPPIEPTPPPVIPPIKPPATGGGKYKLDLSIRGKIKRSEE